MFFQTDELDKTIPIPLYYQLKSILLNDIKSGKIAVGQTIPTEAELQERYQISRSTIRQAISELVHEGLLERRTSKGTIVTKPRQNASHIHPFEPFYQQVTRSGKRPRTEVIELRIMDATQELSEAMNLDKNDKVISMFRRRFADDIPMVTIQNFLPYNLCSFILGHDFKVESLYEVLIQNPKSSIENTKTFISAAKATSKDVQLLQIKLDNPVLYFHTIASTSEGTIVDYAYSHYRGDLNTFEIDVRPQKISD